MIGPVSAKDAVEFVRKWHYSGSAVSGTIRYGWYDDLGQLIGVSIYNTGNHAMREGVFGPEHYEHVIHHHRLALLPEAPKFSASQFIGACHQSIRRDFPNIWAVVTYADMDQGHDGTIYRATNALFTGIKTRGNLYFKTPSGEIRTVQSLKKVGVWSERRVEAQRRGWTEHRCKGKARYVYLLGTKVQRKRRPPLAWPTMEWKPEMETEMSEVPGGAGARNSDPETSRRAGLDGATAFRVQKERALLIIFLLASADAERRRRGLNPAPTTRERVERWSKRLDLPLGKSPWHRVGDAVREGWVRVVRQPDGDGVLREVTYRERSGSDQQVLEITGTGRGLAHPEVYRIRQENPVYAAHLASILRGEEP